MLRCSITTPEDTNACRQEEKINKSVNKIVQLINEAQEVTEAIVGTLQAVETEPMTPAVSAPFFLKSFSYTSASLRLQHIVFLHC